MTILKRTKNIIAAKIQDMDMSFQNPDYEIEKVLEAMNSMIIDLERSAATALAEKKLTEKQIEEMEGEQAEWLEKAKRAVGAGQDDLARRALLQKKSIGAEIENCKEYLGRSNENFMYFKSELKESREKFEELKNKARLAKHKNLMNKMGMGNNGSKEEDDISLELQFENLRKSSNENLSLDEEINKLKKKLKK